MSGGRFKEARELFVEAAATPVEERERFLEEACGDDADLRAEVEELLRFHDEATGSGSELPTPLHPATILPDTPEQIGRYRILQKIGSGGMGEVFEAQQDKPLRRRVALKIIKWGMDTEQVVARFESERQALALMDHPNVARVFDAGATDEGRPFFATEFVKGVPITEYCDTRRLNPRSRLELFIQVCRGAQHAHQRGIIHRDLKPTNILVTDVDGEPTAKIIDFGVAKAISQRITEQTVFTELGQWIGTPEYMSPEQAGMRGFDIDTRTDVYSLGVLLYELLVGVQTFEVNELRSSGFDEMRRKIREQDPPRPSTRVSTGAKASSSEAADRRQTDPPSLARMLRGDLDWIVMKALEKDRNRRYESPADFATDVERHLRDEPVLASPPSVSYRAGKFVRRYRAAVIAGGLILVSLVSGLAVATVGMVRAQRAERLANAQVELLVGMFDSLDPMRDTLESGTTRSGGSTANSCEVLYTLVGLNASDEELERYICEADIPASSESVTITIPPSQFTNPSTIKSLIVSVLPDGNHYVAGTENSITIDNPFTTEINEQEVSGKLEIFPSIIITDRVIKFRMNIPEGIHSSLSNTHLDIFDVKGNLVRSLSYGGQSSMKQEIVWDRRTASGKLAGAGMYLVRLRTGGKLTNAKLILYR